jgi:hypothetical protein
MYFDAGFFSLCCSVSVEVFAITQSLLSPSFKEEEEDGEAEESVFMVDESKGIGT